MSGSVALDVFIGLVFIYLLYSLFVTIVAEMVATWLGLRARVLRVAIERMLNDGRNANNQLITHSRVGKWLERRKIGRGALWIWHGVLRFMLFEFEEFKYSFAGRFYHQPSVKYLGTGQKPQAFSFRHSKPAYFSAETFSETLIHLLRSKGTGATDMEKVLFCLRFNTVQIQPDTIEYLRNLAADSGNDITVFGEKLKGWFQETMDRANGWYKRKLQFLLFWLGFVVVLLFNVDSITIASKLSKDRTARNQLVQMAIQATDDSSGVSRALRHSKDQTINQDTLLLKSYREVNRAMTDANHVLGMGWDSVRAEQLSFSLLGWRLIEKVSVYKQMNPFRAEFWGLVITALALTLGAPFWFDLLRKLVSIRGTGVNPDEENKVNKIRGAPVVPVRGAAAGDQAPAPADETPAGDMIEEAIRVYGPKIRQIPGVRAVLKGLSQGARCVQVNVLDALTRQEVVRQFATLQVGATAFAPVVVVTGATVTQQSTEGTIANKSGLNNFGSLGCVLRNKDTGSRHILSCWHVMKGNMLYDQDDKTKTIIHRKNRQDLAVRWAGGISGAFDFALARCLSETVDNSDLFKALGFSQGHYRPVQDVDINNQREVVYYDSLAEAVMRGRIYTDCPVVDIRYADKKIRAVRDVLVLTNASNDGPRPISRGGNSGSIVFDNQGFAIGMIIAGDEAYTYAMKLSNIFDIHDEMEILNIADEMNIA